MLRLVCHPAVLPRNIIWQVMVALVARHEPRSWRVIGVGYQDSLEASRGFIRNASVATTASCSILVKSMIRSNYNMFHRLEKFSDQDAPILPPLRRWDLCEGLDLSEDKPALSNLGLPLLIPHGNHIKPGPPMYLFNFRVPALVSLFIPKPSAKEPKAANKKYSPED